MSVSSAMQSRLAAAELESARTCKEIVNKVISKKLGKLSVVALYIKR